MLVTQDGKLTERDVVEAAVEAALLRALKKRGARSQTQLWCQTTAHNYDKSIFLAVLDHLVAARGILRTVTRKNGFLYRMPPRVAREASVEKPLTPEAA